MPSADPLTAAKDAIAAGFTGAGLLTAVEVAGAESSWGADPGPSPTNDNGFWQINTVAHPNYNPQQLLTDPAYNAKAAFAISSGGTNWSPWTTYTSGKYLDPSIVSTAKQAIADAGGTVSDTVTALAQFVFPLAAGTYSVGQAYGGPGADSTGAGHPGIDLPAAAGTPIYAAASGSIKSVGGDPSGFGNDYPVEQLADGTTLTYGHASKSFVKPGQSVVAGQVIALVGSEGDSTGDHLHFQVNLPGGALTNPLDWLTSHSAGTAETVAQLTADAAGNAGAGGSSSGASALSGSPLDASFWTGLLGDVLLWAIKGVLVAAGGAMVVLGVASAAGKSTSLPSIIPIPV